VSPAQIHEERKTTLARLLELWAVETDIDLNGFGSWTLKNELKEAGAEPDECYIVGPARDVPHLAIEVEWSKKLGLEKEEIYARLGVRELWTVKADGKLVIRVRAKNAKNKWVAREASAVLPTLDVAWLYGFVEIEPQSAALRALRDALGRRSRGKRRPNR
jgi:Uma2 family endonuclease